MSGHPAPSNFKNPVIRWIDYRLPVFTMLTQEYGVFPTPRNFNYFWNFGAIALFMLIAMIATGVVLAMNYTPNAGLAFDSVERITRDVNFGWLLRALHANGASFFFIAVYIHVFRGLYYGSFKQPRELLWILGVVIMLLMMATAFMGYVLPWGQMSFWGATVITNLFSAVPLVGDSVVTWLWGGFAVDNPTLNRFFALHYLLPFIIFAVVILHVAALHIHGSNNPLGIDVKGPQDTLPFHPYYTAKDTFGLIVFIMVYCAFVFWMPDALGHPDNYTPANPMVTPAHIVPEWYFLPFYAILRAVTFDITIPFTGIMLVEAKLGGVIAMFGAIAALFVLPWLDTHPVRSARFRPVYRAFFWVLLVDCFVLGYVGSQMPDTVLFHITKDMPFLMVHLGQIATAYYFFHFLILLPLLSRIEKARPLPTSIAEAVLKKGACCAALVAALLMMSPAPASASEGGEPNLITHDWPHDGIFGTYDRAALQRGFQVFKEVCNGCHSLKQIAYRNLADLGYNADEIKAIAAQYEVTDGPNDEGEMFKRPALPTDRFNRPFANDNAARAANGGALPPDLSLIVKGREGHEDYIYSLLTGYKTAPSGHEVPEGLHSNTVFVGNQIAMPATFSVGGVTYGDGTPVTVDQMAADVTQFLAWAGEPHLEQRKQTGVKVMLFLFAFAGILYAAKRKVWSKLH